jgi:hypothetical protein
VLPRTALLNLCVSSLSVEKKLILLCLHLLYEQKLLTSGSGGYHLHAHSTGRAVRCSGLRLVTAAIDENRGGKDTGSRHTAEHASERLRRLLETSPLYHG